MNIVAQSKHTVCNYIDNIPSNIHKRAITGAVLSFALEGLVSSAPTLSNCAVCGGVAALAAIIDGVISPLFKNFWTNEHGCLDWKVKALKNVASLGLSTVLICGINASTPLFLLTSAIAHAVCMRLFQPAEGFDPNKTWIYLYF